MKTATLLNTVSSANKTPATSSPTLSFITWALDRSGEPVTRGGLVIVIGWIGAMKFTGYEAGGIAPLVTNSPLMSWMYHFLTVREFSNALGIFEIAVAAGLLLGAFIPRAGVLAGLAAIGMFLGTMSFLATTPGAFEPALGGFPALSALPGQFLLKDLVLLGASVWLTAASFKKPAH